MQLAVYFPPEVVRFRSPRLRSARQLVAQMSSVRSYSRENATRRTLPIMKSILSGVPTSAKLVKAVEWWAWALPIEFIELSESIAYGY
jgi:hypothetical protein